MEAIRRLKGTLTSASALQNAVYEESQIFVTMDTSPTGIEWMINQEDEHDAQFACYRTRRT